MNKVNKNNFDRLPLNVHRFLSGVPLHSLDFIELKGGRKGMMMDEIYRITQLNQAEEIEFGFATTSLFWLRGLIGKILRWDDVPELINAHSWLSRLTEDEREKSTIPSGKIESINTILYCYKNEILFEIINRTVHCFWVLASEEESAGYNLYIAVYVRKLNWQTPIYMTLVSPLLKWIIYPSIKKSIERNWEKSFSTEKKLSKMSVGI